MTLLDTVLREIPQNLKMLTFLNVVSGIVTVLILGIVGIVAKNAAAAGTISLRLVTIYVLAAALFSSSHKTIMITASRDAERLIHILRLRLFDAVRLADMATTESIGRPALQAVLVNDTQILAQTLPMLAIGGQQAIMLVFIAIYLAWLSPMACAMTLSFGVVVAAVRFMRTSAREIMMRNAVAAEKTVFESLTDLLSGFKEMRMSSPRADDLVDAVGQASAPARQANILLKSQWGRNFSVNEATFYTLIGLMVFVMPLLSTGYHVVVMQVTTAALFITGPISTVSFVSPMVAQAEMALGNIEAMERQLRDHEPVAAHHEESPDSVRKNPLVSITLQNALFSYRDKRSETLFTVGPLSAEFRAGEITFVTGGNGSGKSTMLRMLTALMPLDSGVLLVNGEPVAPERTQAYRDRISAIFSDYHLSRRLYGISYPDPERVRALLEQLEMQNKVAVENGAFSTIKLSTGQRKRLAMVVARLADKPVIVLDEWAADQDPHYRRFFYKKLLPELKAEGKIVICVTHDDRWFGLADNIYHMNEGRIEVIDPQPLKTPIGAG